MRARAGDPPRTMAQKVLAARSRDPSLASELIEVDVDPDSEVDFLAVRYVQTRTVVVGA